MNRITQCLHGKGTVSAMMNHKQGGTAATPGRYLAWLPEYRPVLFWNITERCNLNCTHCYSRSGPGTKCEGELTTAEAKALIGDLAEMKVPLILFTGGEPLMRPDLFTLAAYAEEQGIMSALSTNGTLITEEIAAQIKESGIGYAGISLDGATAETHNRFRGSEDAFDQTVAAFSHCNDAGLRCGARVTLTRENYQELEDLIDLALEIGASRFCLYWLVPSGRGGDAYDRLQLDGEEVTAALNLLYQKAKETDPARMEFLTVDAPQDAIYLLHAMRADGADDLEEAESLISSVQGGCSAGRRVASISSDGSVYPCQFAQSDDLLAGNIRDRPFSAIWNDNGNSILTFFRSKRDALQGACTGCSHLAICGGGCRIRALRIRGDINAEDPFCFVSRQNG